PRRGRRPRAARRVRRWRRAGAHAHALHVRLPRGHVGRRPAGRVRARVRFRQLCAGTLRPSRAHGCGKQLSCRARLTRRPATCVNRHQPPTWRTSVDIHDETGAAAARDEADLARFGYKQELRRSLGVFSSFAVAFSYISPSTGIFTLFFLGLTTIGGVFIWSWPIVALGQFIVALGFAELSSHYPVAGSVFQW